MARKEKTKHESLLVF